MRQMNLVILTLGWLALGTASTTASEIIQCPGQHELNHETNLRNAALAELAYSDPGHIENIPHRCPHHTLETSKVEVCSIPERVIEMAKERMVADENQKERKILIQGHPKKPKETHPTYYQCEYEGHNDGRLQFAIGFIWLRSQSVAGLGFVTGIIKGAVGALDEEMKMVRITDGEKLIMAVQGTDIERMGQLAVSLKDMLDKSCAFEFATKVTEEFFSPGHDLNLKGRHGVIVGHSLGGTAVQYVASALDLAELKGKYDLGRLDAYSFNSMGMPPQPGDMSGRLTSVVVAGEFLQLVSQLINREQLGQVYTYDYDRKWQWDWSRDLHQHKIQTMRLARILDDLGRSRVLHRHKIQTVQQKICDCMSSSEVSYQYELRSRGNPAAHNK